MLARRNHVPIITSGNVIFGVGSERVNMQIGECWEINNYRFHWVDNNSDIDRVHLLVDIMPNEELI
jgi:aspartyl/asparaginyl beta-hydroxylase (cupin superfamily)